MTLCRSDTRYIVPVVPQSKAFLTLRTFEIVLTCFMSERCKLNFFALFFTLRKQRPFVKFLIHFNKIINFAKTDLHL